MPGQETDINAAILAELKQMNESLAYIKAVAQRLNDEQNRNAQALDSINRLASSLPRG